MSTTARVQVFAVCATFPRLRRGVLAAFFWTVVFVAPALHAHVWINEFVADNQSGLRTAAGAYADWIELANDGPQSVDLGGWYLTDRASAPTKWRIPDGTMIGTNGYLIIFADSSPVSLTNGELHANFSLSKDGEYLGLFRPDGVTVAHEYAPAFPPQLPDVSYGWSGPAEQELAGLRSPARFRIPDAAGTAPWNLGAGALGCTGASGTFTVRCYEMNTSIANVDAAEMMVSNSVYWKTDRAYPIEGQYDFVDFHGSGVSGNFTNDLIFPGQDYAGQDKDWFVMVAEGAVYVPAAGMWTFCVGSDDGFRLSIAGHGENFVAEYPTGRSFGNSLATFNFPVAGVYDLRLVYYENNGSATVEFSVAQDFQVDFSPDVFRLTGTAESGILHAGAIGAVVETDVGAALTNVNSRLDAEWSFTIEEAPDPSDTFTLWVRCADGFSATLNGTPVAALNAPDPLEWNSAATATRSAEQALQWLSFPVPASAILSGVNTLAVVALNNSAPDREFLIQPRLTRRPAGAFPAYFKTPTPDAANAEGSSPPTPVVTAGEPRGYRNAPFTVTLACTNANAQIRCTFDGSVPTTNSFLYSAPFVVSNTTTLRAAVLDPTSVRQNVTTVTWLFLEDILRQGTSPPPGWPVSRQVNNHVMEYGMRQAIVTGDGARLRNGMTNIPSISLVTDLANLFNAQRGIYVNPGNDGIAWERPVSVELIDPVRGTGFEFHIDAGLRIRGAYSRSSSNPKHSFRLFFRSDYGDGNLNFPLFGTEGANEFDKVDLRCSQNYSWAYENSPNDTFVRETFSRDSQRDMGLPYTRSRYYHLYINGQYWGLYQTQERGDADFAQTYLGGNNTDWDCIKTSQPGYVTTPVDGTFDAFYALHDIAINEGFAGAYAANYYRVKGQNPDGTPNPASPVYLDETNLIIYMLTAYYTGDPDSPVSIWGGMPNNMYGLFNRVSPSGFKWLRHDAEHSLGAHSGYPVTCDTTLAGSTFVNYGNFNPAILHQRLCEHLEYRHHFADLVQKHLYGDGALTPTNAQQRFRSRMSEIDLAIIGESARWGRGKTRDATWLPACNAVVDDYLVRRRDIVISQFRNRGWFPSLDAPSYSVMNSHVATGQLVRVSNTSTFYYTTDGSDPRLPDGSLNPAAIAVVSTNTTGSPRTLMTRGYDWRYFDLGSEPAVSGQLTWRDAGYPDGSWGHGPAIIGFPGSATVNTVATRTRRYVNGVSGAQVTTTYLRATFTLDSTNDIGTLVADNLRDDGVVIYLNGSEVTEWRQNMNPGLTTYDTYAAGAIGTPEQNTYYIVPADAADKLRVGTNTVAVELHQGNSTSSDLYFDFALTAQPEPVQVFADITITNDVLIRARAFDGTEWSALSENSLTLERPMEYAALKVSEMMYAPLAPPAGSPYTADDFAWIELRHAGTAPLNLSGVSFISGITHTFAPFWLQPGARAVLARNPAAFATLYPTNNLNLFAWTSGNLARSGETLSLAQPGGTTNILTFTYSRLWYPETYNTGGTLVAVDLAAPEALWSTASNWRPGRVAFGTPGWPEPPLFSNARLTGDRLLLVDAPGLDGTPELWSSTDLVTWTLCDTGAWSQVNGTFTIDLKHASLSGNSRTFFQARIKQ